MNLNLFQWLFIAFSVLQLVAALRRVRRWHRRHDWLFVGVWLVATVLLVFPWITSWLAAGLGIGRGVDVVIYGLCFLFIWAHYQQYLRYKHLEDNLTLLVRELAIQRAQEPAARLPEVAKRT